MADIHPVERYPAWALQIIFMAAVLTAMGSLLVLSGLHGVAQSPVLAVHGLANALVLVTAWNVFRNEDEAGWLVALSANLGALGFGVVDLVLAGQAATNLQPSTTLLLFLAVPGTAGVLAFSLDRLRKKTPEETKAEDEAVLAGDEIVTDEEDGDAPTWSEKFRAYASVVLFFAAYMFLYIGGFWFFTFWHSIVWHAVTGGAATSALDVLILLWNGVLAQWKVGARIFLMLLGALTLTLIWSLLEDKLKAWRKRRKPIDRVGDARVDAALRAVWDFANRPSRPAKIIPIYVIPALFFVAWLGSFAAYDFVGRDLALRLYEARHAADRGWYYFYGNFDGGIPALLVGAGAFLFGLWLVIVSLWPGAAEAAVTQRYRRNRDAVSTNVEVLRCTLAKYFKRGGGEPFDPQGFLLARRRRFVRWAVPLAGAVTVLAAAFICLTLSTYTVFTRDGLIRQSMLSSLDVAWRDVRSVEIACIAREKGAPQMIWRIHAADGRSANLAESGQVAERLPGLLKVDAILRARNADFGRRVPPSAASDACLESAGADLRDFRGFLGVMHRD